MYLFGYLSIRNDTVLGALRGKDRREQSGTRRDGIQLT